MGISAALGSSALLPAGLGFRNKIINGAMVIDQRKAGAETNPAVSEYTVDRWTYYGSAASKFKFQQNQGSVTPPAGFKNYAGLTSLGAYSIAATDQFLFRQNIEGYNVADLAWGTANAKPVVLSFWVRSSLTGTFGGALQNSDSTRNYPFTYVINAANTWEQKTVYVNGSTDGTWVTDNGKGLLVTFSVGTGSTYSATAGAWSSTQFVTSATGAVSVAGTSGATWYITGVQLEQNYQPTPFEQRPYGVELQLCQRYYTRLVTTNTTRAAYVGQGQARNGTAFVLYGAVPLPVPMRISPALATSGIVAEPNAGGSFALSNTITSFSSTTNAGFYTTRTSGTWAAELSVMLILDTSASYIAADSEL